MTATGEDPPPPGQQFLACLPVIDRLIGIIARRNALSASDADEFAAWARARLMDNDYAIFRKFGGRSSIATYLAVVLSNLFRDWRNSLWGRWRPSAMAVRLGPIAIRLEELLSRDGCSLREAIAILNSAGATETEADLARLAAKLPHRTNDHEVSIDAVVEGIPDPSTAEPLSTDEKRRFLDKLSNALSKLDPEERLLVRMRFWDGMTVADIARALHVEQKPLYRKLESIGRRLREWLRLDGIDDDGASDFLSGDGLW